jgi:hypothetical protein
MYTVLQTFSNANMLAWYLYTVSAKRIVRLLQRNISSDIHIAEFLITPLFEICTKL